MPPVRPRFSSPADAIMSCVGAVAFLFALPFITALASIYDAWIAVKIWHWFIMPASPTIPALSIAFFVGVQFVASILFKKRLDEGDASRSWSKIASRLIGACAVWPTLVCLSAYILHRWLA